MRMSEERFYNRNIRERKTGNKKSGSAILGIGTVSLIFIFLLLCLVIFAVLSYSSAASDYRLSQKAAERTTAYYEASNLAQEKLSELDMILQDAYEQTDSDGEYFSMAEARLQQLFETDAWKQTVLAMDGQEGMWISWEENVDANQALQVTLYVGQPQPGESFYNIEQYQTKAKTEWNGDTSIKVYGSEKSE